MCFLERLPKAKFSLASRRKPCPQVRGEQSELPNSLAPRALSLEEGGVHEEEYGMAVKDKIAGHMEVVGSDGKHVGTVDHLEGVNQIKLTKNDPASKGTHHFIPVDWVEHVDEKVHLTKTSAEAFQQWV